MTWPGVARRAALSTGEAHVWTARLADDRRATAGLLRILRDHLDGLRERLTSTFGPDLLAVHYDIRYREVVFLPTKVLVDYTYIGRFRINGSEGTRWERRLSDNRMVLAKTKQGGYAILSGM